MIEGIEIQGRCYLGTTTIDLFTADQRVAIVFGRNGSGKSTIGDAFGQFSDGVNADGTPRENDLEDDEDDWSSWEELAEDQDSELQARLLLSQAPSGRQMQATHRCVMVFNETFIESNVKLKGQGLGTIALLGDQGDATERLKPAEARLTDCLRRLEQIDAERDQQQSEQAATSSAVKQTIKNDWAVRQKHIRRKSTNTPVTDSVIARVATAAPAIGELAEVRKTLMADIEAFRTVADEQELGPLPQLGPLAAPDTAVLTETLPPPTGAGLAAVIAESLKLHEHLVREGAIVFEDPTVTHCPTCQQPIADLYRESLLAAVSAAIDAPNDAFARRIEASKLRLLDPGSLHIDQRLDAALISKFMSDFEHYNSAVSAWNSTCDAKQKNLYGVLDWNGRNLEAARGHVKESYRNLEEAREVFNRRVRDRRKQQDRLEQKNLELARLEIDTHLTRLETANSALQATYVATTNARKDWETAQAEVSRIHAEMKNFHVAIEEMNNYLAAIFADNTRLALRLEEDEVLGPLYRLTSRGREVKPERLSVGERNVLALTYFFTLVRGKTEGLDQSDESMRMFIVLDDPISSLDADNRVGIQSFIFSRLRELLKSNPSTRVLFLTHDFNVAVALEAGAIEALMIPTNRDDADEAPQVKEDQLVGKKTAQKRVPLFIIDGSHQPESQSNFDNRNEYKVLLRQVWEYAKSSTPATKRNELSPFIGNITRRILEAFSYFIYGVTSITHPRVEDQFSDQSKGQSLALALGPGHRQLLHGQSHAPGGNNALAWADWWGAVSEDEKLTHVRRVLRVMYTLQAAHVLAYLNVSGTNFEEEIPSYE